MTDSRCIAVQDEEYWLTLSTVVTVYVLQQSAAVNGTAVAQWCAAHNRTVVDTLFMSDVPCDRSA
jgi:hypothetical protein